MLQGLMMQMPLLISSLIEHADRHHGEPRSCRAGSKATSIATTYRELHRRAGRWPTHSPARHRARRPRRQRSAWNGYRHMELYFAVSGAGSGAAHDQPAPASGADRLDRRPCRGPGAVLRPDVPAAGRGDRAALHDGEALGAMTDRAHMPAEQRQARNLLCYEELIERPNPIDSPGPSSTRTPRRRSATRRARPATRRACCTAIARRSCTRSPSRLPDALTCSARDVILPVVPMFHVNAWGLPYVAPHGGLQAGLSRPATWTASRCTSCSRPRR